jgi:hypothetical protein
MLSLSRASECTSRMELPAGKFVDMIGDRPLRTCAGGSIGSDANDYRQGLVSS